MAGIDQHSSFNLTLDGVHSIKVKDHAIFGEPFNEWGYVTFESYNIHNPVGQRMILWFDNRADEIGQTGLTLSDIAQFGLSLAQKVADIKTEQINKAEKILKEASNA